MPTKKIKNGKSHKNHSDEKIIELSKSKPRDVQEKFSSKFSRTQLNVVSLIILGATFLVQGIIRYLEFFDKMQYIKPWFMIILFTMIFLVLSVIAISFENVFSPLKFKRLANMTGFIFFILGFFMFLLSLFFLLFII